MPQQDKSLLFWSMYELLGAKYSDNHKTFSNKFIHLHRIKSPIKHHYLYTITFDNLLSVLMNIFNNFLDLWRATTDKKKKLL